MVTFIGKNNAGRMVFVDVEDKGFLVPGYDADKNRIEAHTTWVRVREHVEEYQQIARDFVENERNPREMLKGQLIECLKGLGVDVAGLKTLPEGRHEASASFDAVAGELFNSVRARPATLVRKRS